MDLEKILEMCKKDSVIDEVLIDEAALKIPQLHQKYLTLHSEYLLLSKRKQQDLKRLQHKKTLYYSGRAKPEEYEEPFEYKVMKSDIPSWVAVDEEVQRVELKLEYYYATIRALEDILKQVHQLSFNIKNVIEWRRFAGGA